MKIRQCRVCGEREHITYPCESGYVCKRCLDRGRKGRDVTTRAARSTRFGMEQQSVAKRCELHGDNKSAVTHHRQAHGYAAQADELWKPPDNVETVLGEVVPTKPGWVTDILKTPDAAALDASAHRLELLDRMGNDCTTLALDAAASANAENSLERMLCHQLAVVHKTALDITGKAVFEQDAIGKGTTPEPDGTPHGHVSARLARPSTAARWWRADHHRQTGHRHGWGAGRRRQRSDGREGFKMIAYPMHCAARCGAKTRQGHALSRHLRSAGRHDAGCTAASRLADRRFMGGTPRRM